MEPRSSALQKDSLQSEPPTPQELGEYLAYVKQIFIEGLLLSTASGWEGRKWAGTFSWDN